ncbi:hypothetical protein VTJ83DRAFT_5067 [Remersonia thermophila]|uniref:Uncharacterized protein n=1 Tax=Remersonia thermophila TaxID=72144 RepID=A0ABR4DBR8_9PEZI
MASTTVVKSSKSKAHHPPPPAPPQPSARSYPPSHTDPPASGTAALPYRPRPENAAPQPSSSSRSDPAPKAASDYPPQNPALTLASPRPISEVGVNHYPVNTNTGPGTDRFPPQQQQPQQQQQQQQQQHQNHHQHPYQPYYYPYPYPYPYQYQHPPPGPPSAPAPLTTALIQTIPAHGPLSAARTAAQAAVKELLSLRRQRAMLLAVQAQPNGVDPLGVGSGHGSGGGANGAGKAGYDRHHERANLHALRDVEDRLRAQHYAAVQGLWHLQGRVAEVARRAEGKRWRRLAFGGIIAYIIPLVKKLYGRPVLHKHVSTGPGAASSFFSDDYDEPPSNSTERAWRRSKRLVARILEEYGRPGLGTLAFFVFAVLYVFTNEVSLRAARSVARRLGRLAAKLDEGREEVGEADMKALRGWKWRVVGWSDE